VELSVLEGSPPGNKFECAENKFYPRMIVRARQKFKRFREAYMAVDVERSKLRLIRVLVDYND
jgi:hypothetical protein